MLLAEKMVATSREYLKATITAPIPLTDLPVEVAVTTGADPEEADWKDAAWNDDGDVVFLVGPETDFPLDPRTAYVVFVRITGSPEIPVLVSGAFRTR